MGLQPSDCDAVDLDTVLYLLSPVKGEGSQRPPPSLSDRWSGRGEGLVVTDLSLIWLLRKLQATRGRASPRTPPATDDTARTRARVQHVSEDRLLTPCCYNLEPSPLQTDNTDSTPHSQMSVSSNELMDLR